MATVTHIIRSHYDPADHEKLERDGQRTDDDTSDPWQTDSFSTQRRIRAAPSFVPATLSYDEWGVPSHTSSPAVARTPREAPDHLRTSTAEWYRSLTASSSSSSHQAPPPRRSSSATPSQPPPDARPRPPQTPTRRENEKHLTRHDEWFIRKALCSAPSPTQPGSPAPSSLADLLARDPPPLPWEGRYAPPVWLHIGPSNRGFGMLQRGGWNEGEGLGAHVVRRVARAEDVDERPSSVVEVEEDVADVRMNAPEVIDLTLSDSEASEDEAFEEDDDVIQALVQTQPYTRDVSASHMQRSLLTPLPIVLKADRLGIGMKAKTEGPYKQSKKRVTHSAAALAAHIRSAEEMRRSKAAVGKGKRGFAKIHKREEDRRKAMLAYLHE